MKKLFLMSVFSMLMVPALSGVALAHDDDGNENESGAASFQCPDGVAQCYSADGTLVTNVNYLPATAAGHEDESHGSEHGTVQAAAQVNPALPRVVAPKHFSSF